MRPFETHDLMVAVLPERADDPDPLGDCPQPKTPCTNHPTTKPKPKPRATDADLAALRAELRVLEVR